MSNLLEEFKSAMEEAEDEDYTVVISSLKDEPRSIRGNQSGMVCAFTFPRIDFIEENYLCISNFSSPDQLVVSGEYEIEKTEIDGDIVYKIKCDDDIYVVEIIK